MQYFRQRARLMEMARSFVKKYNFSYSYVTDQWPAQRDNFFALQQGQALLWLPVVFGVGVALDLVTPWTAERYALAALAGILGLLSFILKWPRLGIALLVLLTGGLRMEWREHSVRAPVLTHPMSVGLTVKVDSTTQVDDKRWIMVAAPIAADRHMAALTWLRISVKGLIGPVKPGDVVRLRARLRPPPEPISPGGFDAMRRSWFAQVGAYGVAMGDIEIVTIKQKRPFLAAIDRARGWLSARFRAEMPGNPGEVAVALITGDNDGLDQNTAQDVRAASLPHLLTVSGFHLAIVTGFSFWGIRRLMALFPRLALHYPGKPVAALASGVVAIIYTLFTGAAYPTVRSGLGCLLILTAVALGRRPLSLRLLAAAAFAILLAKPESIINISFQLSFAAVTGLFVSHQSKLGRWLSKKDPDDGWPLRFMKVVGSGVLSSLGTEAAIAPIALAHFNQIGLYGMFANGLAVPLTTFLLMPVGLLMAVLAPLGLDHLLAPIMNIGCVWFLRIATTVAHWPSALIYVANIGTLALGLALFAYVWIANIIGPARALALPLLVFALIAAWVEPLPDVRIAPDANFVAVRAVDGTLVVSDQRRGRYIRDSWLEDSARPSTWNWSDGGAGFGVPMVAPSGCGGPGCTTLLTRGGRTWRISYLGRMAEADHCPAADVVIDGRLRRELRCHAGLVIDRRWLLENGATEIIAGEHGLKLTTDRNTRGDHLWSGYR